MALSRNRTNLGTLKYRTVDIIFMFLFIFFFFHISFYFNRCFLFFSYFSFFYFPISSSFMFGRIIICSVAVTATGIEGKRTHRMNNVSGHWMYVFCVLICEKKKPAWYKTADSDWHEMYSIKKNIYSRDRISCTKIKQSSRKDAFSSCHGNRMCILLMLHFGWS